MKSRFLGQAGVLVVVLTVTAIGTPSSARADWTFEVIDDVGQYPSDPALVIDADGNPHLVYRTPAGDLRYAKRIGGAWQLQDVQSCYSGGGGDNPSLALDSQGRPHIAYFTDTPGPGGNLYYTHWTGTEWQCSMIGWMNNAFPSLALTTADEPRIAWNGWGGNYGLFYAVPDGAGWSVTYVDCCYQAAGDCSLALDGNDNPRIGWGYGGDSHYFSYYWLDGGAWSWETPYSGATLDVYSVSMALDTADQPHATFVQDYYVKYARRIAGVWSLDTVTSVGLNYSSGLALDAYDNPYIVYLGTSGSLNYAHRTTSSWCLQTLEPSGCGGPTIAVDSAGSPHIAYHTGSNGVVKYAWWEPSVVTGDLDCSGCVDFGDINPFVQFLADFNGWQATYPNCPPENGDINADGLYPDFGDINPFVALLSGSL